MRDILPCAVFFNTKQGVAKERKTDMEKSRRLLAILLSIIMVTAYMPALAYAEDYEGKSVPASTGDTYSQKDSSIKDKVDETEKSDHEKILVSNDTSEKPLSERDPDAIDVNEQSSGKVIAGKKAQKALRLNADGEDEGPVYDLNDGVLVISGSGAVEDGLYMDNTEITELVIEEGITSIGANSFANASSLQSVSFPSSLTEIGEAAFSGCTSLTALELTDGITTIGAEAFKNDTALTEVYIPVSVQEGSVTYYYDENSREAWGIFEGCENLTTVTFEEGTTSIHGGLFAGSGLKEAVLPDTVTTIYGYAFANCRSLTSVDPGSAELIEEYAFASCSALEAIILPDTLSEIKPFAFYGCESLPELHIPEAVSNIGESAFGACTGLSELSLSAGYMNNGYCEYAWDEVTYDADGPFSGCTSLSDVVIEEGTTRIPAGLFADSGITEISLPSTLESINSFAFSNSALTKITIPDSVYSISYCAFSGCTSLAEVHLSKGWTLCRGYGDETGLEAQGRIFYGCTSLTMIILPDGLEAIPDYAFANCEYIKIVSIPASVKTRAKSSAVSTVTSIGDYSFYNCSALTSIAVPAGVESLGSSSFENCESLMVVNMSDSVKTVKDNAFENCTSLARVNYSGSSADWQNIDFSETGNSFSDDVIVNYDFNVVFTENDFLGVWEGEYDGNSGDTIVRRHFGLMINSCTLINDEVAEISGSRSISQSIERPSDLYANGSDSFSGTVNLLTGAMSFQGYEWFEIPMDKDQVEDPDFGHIPYDGFLEADKKSMKGFNDGDTSRTYYANLITGQPENGTGVTLSADGNVFDLLTQFVTVMYGSDSYVTISVTPDWAGAEPGTIRLFQKNVSVESKTGMFLDIQPGKVFEPNTSVFIALIDVNGETVDSKEINLIISDGTEPGTTITEDMLYGPYCKYLTNTTYESHITALIMDMSKVYSDRTPWDNYSAILISNMKAGGVKSFINSIICDVTKRYYKQDEIEEELAIEYIQALSQVDPLMDDVVKTVSKDFKWGERVYKIIKAGATSHSEKLELAKKIEEATGNKFDKSAALAVIRETENRFDEIDNVFKASGIIVNATEVAVTVMIAAATDEALTQRLMDIIDKDTSLYNGLRLLKKKQNHTARVFVQQLFEKEVFDKIASEMTKQGVGRLANFFVGNGFIKPGMSTAVAGVGFYVVGSVLDHYMASSDEVIKAYVALSNMMELQCTVTNMRTKMQEVGNGAAYRGDYIFAYKAYLESVKNSVDKVLAIAVDNDARTQLINDYNKYKKLLSYNAYIKACLSNANKKLSYTVKDGKATIIGNNKPPHVLAPRPAKLALFKVLSEAVNGESDENSYAFIDIPTEIDGYPVVGIGEEAFLNDETIGSVYIPEGVVTIGSNAFAGCSNMSDIFFGGELKDIGDYAFKECTAMDQLTLPDSVETLGTSVFSGIESITVSAKNTEVIDNYCKTSDDNVLVNDLPADLKEISILSPATNQSYTMSEISEPDEKDYESGKTSPVDLSGLTLKATYDDGSEETVEDGFYAEFEEKKAGESLIIVHYQGKTVSYTVDVTNDECKYDISYVDEWDNEIADVKYGTAMSGNKITVDVPEIEGYRPISEVTEQMIGADNHFVVNYETIKKPSVDDAEITLSGTSFEYTGKEITPEVKVIYQGNTLVKDKDYILIYENNIEVGEAAVEIDGIGEYEGVAVALFTIEAASTDPCKNGHTFGSWTVTRAATEIAEGLRTRKCSVCGTVETASIPMLAPTLKAVKISKPKAGKKSGVVKWKKLSKANLKKIKKIEIQYGLDKNFRTGFKSKFASAKKTEKKLSRLQKGKKYYVRIRAYTVSGGAVHVSKWSKTKSFKVK